MNITPRVKSARNGNNLIVNVSIQIPLKNKYPVSHRSQETSVSPSPNRLKKKYKLIATSNHEKKTLNSSNLNTVRDVPNLIVDHPPSRKKYTNPTPSTTLNHSTKGGFTKFKSCDLSPKKKCLTQRKGKDHHKITRNISILERAINEDDNIIKYTTNSNELKEKHQDFILIENLGRKIDTHISEVDILEIRKIENSAKDHKEKQYLSKINDILRTASAKKIQRAWRNYKTKKLIRSYSNDIRNKYLRNINISEEPLTVRSQGIGLKFKKKLPDFQEINARDSGSDKSSVYEQNGEKSRISEKPDKSSKIVKKIQEDNMEKWEGLLEQIKNKKNLTAALEFSISKKNELQKQLDKDFFKKQGPLEGEVEEKKIIKTKKYYETERQQWREAIQRSNGSIKREERVNYFQNEMMKLENDYSDSGDSSLVNSFEIQSKELEEIENMKLRKKLEIFKNHLPEINPYFPPVTEQQVISKPHAHSNRIDIATIIRKKNEIQEKANPPLAIPKPQTIQESNILSQTPKAQKQLSKNHSIQILQFDVQEDVINKSLNSQSSEDIMDTHREWRPVLQLQQKLQGNWKDRLKVVVARREQQMNQVIFQQLILQALIEISQSQKLINFFKNIHDQKKKLQSIQIKKAEGILTNHASIKDYLNFFINYLYQYQIADQIYRRLLKPIGPTPKDLLRYFRGEDIQSDADCHDVMGIQIFGMHWDYASDLIYFDQKYPEDPKMEAQRVAELKRLTKIFFRAIFDCFNQALRPQRIYGTLGKPFPWSLQKLGVEAPTLKKAISLAFHRVVKYSLVFAGVLLEDKHHNFDAVTVEQIKQGNMVKLLTMELNQDQPGWMFYQDELAEIKLQLTRHIQTVLFKEMAKVLCFGLSTDRVRS